MTSESNNGSSPPSSVFQAILHLCWPPNTRRKKIIFWIVLCTVILFFIVPVLIVVLNFFESRQVRTSSLGQPFSSRPSPVPTPTTTLVPGKAPATDKQQVLPLPQSHNQEEVLLKKEGNDVLVHERIAELIYEYDSTEPVYVAYGEPDGCGPVGNVWMQNSSTVVSRYVMNREGHYLRAIGMTNVQFQVVQLAGNRAGGANVRWARLEYLSRELGDHHFNGYDCRGAQRSALLVK